MIAATYTMPSAALLSGVTVRAFACGRYLNNSGAALSPTFSTLLNSVAQVSQSVVFQTNTVACAWRVWAHFYFTVAIPNSGNLVSVGSCMDIVTTSAFGNATMTGGFGNNVFVIDTNPYNTFINPAQTATLELDFIAAGGDAIELHAGYMEAL